MPRTKAKVTPLLVQRAKKRGAAKAAPRPVSIPRGYSESVHANVAFRKVFPDIRCYEYVMHAGQTIKGRAKPRYLYVLNGKRMFMSQEGWDKMGGSGNGTALDTLFDRIRKAAGAN